MHHRCVYHPTTMEEIAARASRSATDPGQTQDSARRRTRDNRLGDGPQRTIKSEQLAGYTWESPPLKQ